jgi:hypothetical protein
MNRRIVQEYVEGKFPGFAAKWGKTYSYRNSEIIIFGLQRDEILEEIVVKISRNFDPCQVALEFENLSRFYNGCDDPRISSPKPLFVEPNKGILAMRYVNGTNLSYMLHEIKPVSRKCQNHFVDVSAIALARFHNIFSWPKDEPFRIGNILQEDDINKCIAESKGLIDDCNLSLKVTPFFDFTPWNIIVERGSNKICLIDFPRQDYIYTPHLDLARFRFSLELAKQFPPAKFFGFNRWDVDQLFDRFLSGYCHEMQVKPTQNDLWLIGRFRKANIRRAQDLARKGKYGLQPRLEKAYLQTFCREWLDQKGVFAQWPRMGQAKEA